MKTTATKQLQTETLQPKANKQAGAQQILQRYTQQTAQLQAAEEEEPLQGKFETTQLASEEEELLQGKFESIQRMELDEEEPLQGKFEKTQLATEEEEPLQRQPNNTGLPDNLKSGIENLSGYSMDDVKVHYNSDKPAQLQAHAYAQGTDIHVAPGQEKHVPHEAWHVVQQKEGRVQPTKQLKGTTNINDDAGLEKEADVMGAKAMFVRKSISEVEKLNRSSTVQAKLVQLYTYGPSKTRTVVVKGTGFNNTKQFEECNYNSVEFNKGEILPSTGTATGEASWKGLLVNVKGGNNATQLHVVNKRWGGKGGANEKNIVPGSPAENSHHLHEAEKKFDDCFKGNVAVDNCKYECWADPKYNSNVDVSAGNLTFGDPTIKVSITNSGVKTDYSVTPGPDGIMFKQF